MYIFMRCKYIYIFYLTVFLEHSLHPDFLEYTSVIIFWLCFQTLSNKILVTQQNGKTILRSWKRQGYAIVIPKTRSEAIWESMEDHRL